MQGIYKGVIMDLDEWLYNNRINITKFCKEIKTTFPTLSRIRNKDLPVICKVISEIEKKTKGQVTFKDMLDDLGGKKIPKNSYKPNRRQEDYKIEPSQSLKNFT